MPIVNISPYIRNQYFDDNGEPLAGGLLYTKAAGTDDDKTTYSDAGGTVPNANPIVLDASGRLQLYLAEGAYKFILKDSDENTIWTEDNVAISSITEANDFSVAGKITCPHPVYGEEPLALIDHRFDEDILGIRIGGGTTSTNTPTEIVFYLANNTTTVMGTAKVIFLYGDASFENMNLLVSGGKLSVSPGDDGVGANIDGEVTFPYSLVVGAPTGGNKGEGSINAEAVYDDNVILTGYVLDKAFNKAFDINEWDKRHLAGRHEPARSFDKQASMLLDVDAYCDFIASRRMLPTFEDVETSGDIPSTGAMVQKLWEVVEIQSVHIRQLNERLKKLEQKGI
jgi:hypothetical protein